MVGMAFIEKMLDLDKDVGRYFLRTCGEEDHLGALLELSPPVEPADRPRSSRTAYNRVGLTEYFQHRNVSDLYLNSPSWYASQLPDRFAFSTGEKVIEIDPLNKNVFTSKGNVYQCAPVFACFAARTDVLFRRYDILVLATGSNGALPPYVSSAQAAETKGVFVYRNVSDLEAIMDYADKPEITRASVVGGGVRPLASLPLLRY